MPKVGGKKFAYSAKGKADAKKFAAKSEMPMKSKEMMMKGKMKRGK